MTPSLAASPVRLVEADASSAVDILGVTVLPLVSNSESADHFGVFCALVPPGAGIPPHTHPDVELFFMLEGELKIFLDGGGFTVSAHQGDFVPSNAVHGFMNDGAGTAKVLITCTRGLENFFVEAGRPVALAEAGGPSPEEISRVLGIAARHGQVFPAQ